jgi:nitrate/TMAO reductase-like tetraheme cytochrome c subunit
MNALHTTKRLGIALLLITLAGTASAFPRFARLTKKDCATCHTNVAGGAALTDAGKAFKADTTKAPAANVEGATYVSNAKCKMCHLTEYKSWQSTPHAKALDMLKSADAAKVTEMSTRLGVKLTAPAAESPECLQCHVTGHGLAGGYPGADSTKTAALSGVTCESCHGPGSKHVAAAKEVKKTFINGKVSESYCRSCHTPTMSPKFDFAAYSAKGLHEKKAAE